MASFVERVQNILLKPKAEWAVIDGEPATTQSLFLGYACILAAIPAIARIIGGLWPVCFIGVCVSHNPIFDIVGGVLDYIASLVGVFVFGYIIDALAPSFGGQKDLVKAMKVAVYSSTALWIAGIFNIYPLLGLLAIVGGLYSWYLLYLGLPGLMKSPADKAIGYTVVSILIGIVVFLVIGFVSGIVEGIGMAAPAAVLAPVAPAAAIH